MVEEEKKGFSAPGSQNASAAQNSSQQKVTAPPKAFAEIV